MFYVFWQSKWNEKKMKRSDYRIFHDCLLFQVFPIPVSNFWMICFVQNSSPSYAPEGCFLDKIRGAGRATFSIQKKKEFVERI